jgi:DNA-binding NarL/FixJ family response regulator
MLGLVFAAAIFADSAIVRRGLTEILGNSAELRVVSSAPLAAARGAEAEPVDVVVEDVPDAASVELALAQLPGRAPVLALVTQPEHARALVRGGARGALGRDAASDRLTAASIAVASGLHVFDTDTFPSLLAPGGAPDGAALLTPREREVLEHVASGLSNRAIADELDVSEHTVKFHVRSLLDKLGADTRADAVAKAARRGLLAL